MHDQNKVELYVFIITILDLYTKKTIVSLSLHLYDANYK